MAPDQVRGGAKWVSGALLQKLRVSISAVPALSRDLLSGPIQPTGAGG